MMHLLTSAAPGPEFHNVLSAHLDSDEFQNLIHSVTLRTPETSNRSSIFAMMVDDPIGLKSQCDLEPQHNIQTSFKMLEEYAPMTRGMKKAKSFWLKTEKYRENPNERGRIQDEYPNEVLEIQTMVLEKHSINMLESLLTKGYHRIQLDPVPLPSEFVNLNYYCELEPGDLGERALGEFLGADKSSGAAWRFNEVDFRTIERNFPEKVDELKNLLWLRHLANKAQRERRWPSDPEATRAADRPHRIRFYTVMSISGVTSIALTALTIFLAQPLLLIPALLSAAIVVITPFIYPFY